MIFLLISCFIILYSLAQAYIINKEIYKINILFSFVLVIIPLFISIVLTMSVLFTFDNYLYITRDTIVYKISDNVIQEENNIYVIPCEIGKYKFFKTINSNIEIMKVNFKQVKKFEYIEITDKVISDKSIIFNLLCFIPKSIFPHHTEVNIYIKSEHKILSTDFN